MLLKEIWLHWTLYVNIKSFILRDFCLYCMKLKDLVLFYT